MQAITLFSGGGGVDLGLHAAGLSDVSGIEFIDAIAQNGRRNGLNIHTADVLDVDHTVSLVKGQLYILHISPPCPRFSVANKNKGETESDIALAQAITDTIKRTRPIIFTLENVIGYANSQSFKLILKTLHQLGYNFDHKNIMMADYGVPQTRKRLILIARRDGCKATFPTPTHTKNPKPVRQGLFGAINPLRPWNGWLEAIKHELPNCEPTELADWQKKKLPQHILDLLLDDSEIDTSYMLHDNSNPIGGKYVARSTPEEKPSITVCTRPIRAIVDNSYLVNHQGFNNDPIEKSGEDPSFAITSTHGRVPLRAIINSQLVSGQHTKDNNGDLKTHTVDAQNPSITITTRNTFDTKAILVSGENASTSRPRPAQEPAPTITTLAKVTPPKAILTRKAQVIKLNPYAMAALQSFPRSYIFFPKAPAHTIIGNAVPPLFIQILYKHLLQAHSRSTQSRPHLSRSAYAAF